MWLYSHAVPAYEVGLAYRMKCTNCGNCGYDGHFKTSDSLCTSNSLSKVGYTKGIQNAKVAVHSNEYGDSNKIKDDTNHDYIQELHG